MIRRSLLFVLFALVVAGAVWLAFLRPTPERVSLATAQRGPLAVTVEEEGHTRVRERYEVTAPIAGWTPRIALDAGDAVHSGQTLVTLQPLPAASLDPRTRAEAEVRVERARSALQAEQSRLDAARAVAEHARSDYQRLTNLARNQNVSQRELDQALMEARRAEAELEAARHAVEIARHELDAAQTRLRYAGEHRPGEAVAVSSPIDGRVLALQHESAGVVSAGQPLLTVGNPESLEVVVEVLSDDAVRLEPGMPVRFHAWGGNRPLAGEVRRIEPSGFTEVSALGVEEQRVRVIADFVDSPVEAGLGDQYRVEAEFILWQDDDVLQIPESALFEVNGGHAVYVAAGDHAQLRAVTVGRISGLAVQIEDGLQAGERVILQPGKMISDGTAIEPFNQNGE